jgi:hypothetical protein
MSPHRTTQLIALRNRLNEAGEPTHYREDASDTVPPNGSDWNKRRVRVRNLVNARLYRKVQA